MGEQADSEYQKMSADLEQAIENNPDMTLAEGIAEMQQFEMERCLGKETEVKLKRSKDLLEKGTDLNKEILKKRIDARTENAESKLRQEFADDIAIAPEEQDLLAEMGEGDDWWWEDTLTRAVVAENENGKSEWDVLEAEQKRLKEAMKRRQQEERKRLEGELDGDKQTELESVDRAAEIELKNYETKLIKAGIKPDDDPNDSKTAQKLIEAGLQSNKEFRARLEREREAKKQRTLKRHAERRAKALKKQELGHDLE